MSRKLNQTAAIFLAISAGSSAWAGGDATSAVAFRLDETPATADDVINPSPTRPDRPRIPLPDKDPACKPRADMNGDGAVTWIDVVNYLEAYFSSSASSAIEGFSVQADVNNDKHRTAEDIFMFLEYWLSGAC